MTELAVYEPSATLVALPDRTGHPGTQDFDSWVAVASDVIKLSNVIHDTPFIPDGLRGSAPAVAAAILAGREMGLGPMTSLQHIHVIKGKPSQSALLMRAMIQSRGHKWEDGDVSNTRAVVRGCRKGESTWLEVTFTDVMAKSAGIDLGKYPADKLYARATSRLARRKFADVVMGMPYSAEELEDGDFGEDETIPAAPVADQPKPRTAQRRQAVKTPAAEVTNPTPSPEKSSPQPPPQGTTSAMPPLPGEDEPDEALGQHDLDYDTPGTVTPAQLTKIAVVMGELGFTKDQRDDRLKLAARIAGRALESSKDLSKREAMTLIDTIERCGCDYDKLQLLLDDGDKPEPADA